MQKINKRHKLFMGSPRPKYMSYCVLCDVWGGFPLYILDVYGEYFLSVLDLMVMDQICVFWRRIEETSVRATFFLYWFSSRISSLKCGRYVPSFVLIDFSNSTHSFGLRKTIHSDVEIISIFINKHFITISFMRRSFDLTYWNSNNFFPLSFSYLFKLQKHSHSSKYFNTSKSKFWKLLVRRLAFFSTP